MRYSDRHSVKVRALCSEPGEGIRHPGARGEILCCIDCSVRSALCLSGRAVLLRSLIDSKHLRTAGDPPPVHHELLFHAACSSFCCSPPSAAPATSTILLLAAVYGSSLFVSLLLHQLCLGDAWCARRGAERSAAADKLRRTLARRRRATLANTWQGRAVVDSARRRAVVDSAGRFSPSKLVARQRDGGGSNDDEV